MKKENKKADNYCNSVTPDVSMDDDALRTQEGETRAINSQGRREGEFGVDATQGVTDNAPYRALPAYTMIMPKILEDDYADAPKSIQTGDATINSQGS